MFGVDLIDLNDHLSIWRTQKITSDRAIELLRASARIHEVADMWKCDQRMANINRKLSANINGYVKENHVFS